MQRPLRRNLPAVLCLALQANALVPAMAAGTDASRTTAYASKGYGVGKILQGNASVTNDIWMRYFQSGSQALDKRLYEAAVQRLSQALAELRRRNITDVRSIQTREALGRAYLGMERYDEAVRVLTDSAARADKLGPAAAGARARAYGALAEAHLFRHNFDKSEEAAKAAISATESGVNEPRTHARAYMALGDSLMGRGHDLEAAEAYRKSLSLFDQYPDSEPQDIADSQYRLAMALRAQGNEAEATGMFNRAFATYDRLAQFNKALALTPRLNFRWEEGSPRARVVPDQDYPLKYVYINGLRVAVTLVRSENVIAVLISLANVSRTRKELALGKVSLVQLAPKHKEFRYVHPRELDTALEAEHVTELTWRRRWLNHIEKTRRIPGYLKDGILDVDNFFGNNTFGPYGNWQTLAHSETPIVTREQFLYSPYKESAPEAADFLSHTPVGTRPTYLDVGDAKTGLVYFGQERFTKALLRVVIGNTVVEFPFDSAGPR